jgi:single-strand DNA-binding protein
MANFNKVMLMGNLTRDPQLRQLPAGNTVVAEFGLATNRRYRTAGGEDKEETAFVDCSAFGRQAEVIAQHCTKGKPLFVEGRLKYDSWDDKFGGGKRSKLTVVVENFQFIGSKDANANRDDFPSDMFSGAAAADRERSNKGDHAERPAAEPAERNAEPARRNNLRGQRAAAGAREKTGAEQPFGEEKQFTEADIPF